MARNQYLVLCIALMPILGFADQVSLTKPITIQSIQVGRYLTAKVAPKAEQRDLLNQTIQIHFPESIKTVGQALTYVLLGSGYHIDPNMQKVMQVAGRFKQPLPEVHRDLGPVTLKQAVQTIMGKPFAVSEDVLKRTVLFQAEQKLKIAEAQQDKKQGTVDEVHKKIS